MTREQIIEEVVWLLDRQLGSGIGSIHQEPYKGDVFKLFAEAYNQGFIEDESLVADALQNIVIARWFSHNENEDKNRTYFLDKLHTCWHEWQYAWNHCDKKRA